MKITVIILIVLAALGGGGYFWYQRQAQAKEGAGTAPVTAVVDRGAVKTSVLSTGAVSSKLDTDIKCKASGLIIKLPFEISNTVKKGDLLMQLDTIDEDRAIEQAKASLAASDATLAQARQNVLISQANLVTARAKAQATLMATQASAKDTRTKAERVKALLEQKLDSQEDYDSAEAAAVQAQANLLLAQTAVEELKSQELGIEMKKQDVNLAQAQVDKARVALAVAQEKLEETKVYAPIDGVIADRQVQIGEMMTSASTNTGGGNIAMSLSDLSQMFVNAAVDESDIGKVKMGQAVMITADSFPGVMFSGKVMQIAIRGVNATNVVTFGVKIEVTSENKSMLKPVMTTNVEIIAAQKADALRVPADAVVVKGKQKVVTVVIAGGGTEDRPVETGITDGETTEILSGTLAPGEKVVLRKDLNGSRWNNVNQGRPRSSSSAKKS